MLTCGKSSDVSVQTYLPADVPLETAFEAVEAFSSPHDPLQVNLLADCLQFRL